MEPFLPAEWLPTIFASLMGLSILLYVLLDGLDLGIGVLSLGRRVEDRDLMIASIGPFWDANETWLVLAIGILLVAFPVAHGMILTALYLPVALMLIGLTMRGVAFEFRVKAPYRWKPLWNNIFFAGSLLASVTQGYMLGAYVLGFQAGWWAFLFGLLTAACLTAGYAFVGAAWLIWKTEGALQEMSVRWARGLLPWVAVGMVAISLVTPLVSSRIFDRWFSFPELLLLTPLPLMTGLLFLSLAIFLKTAPRPNDRLSWVPLVGAMALFTLAFFGLAYSFYPYVVPEQLSIYDAAASPESLSIILIGTMIVLPVIIAYSVLAHWIFRGKATPLSYY
jgi:cytochrome d ubiquinol oxidase subunit II